MVNFNFDGAGIGRTEEGFLKDWRQWTEEVAQALAAIEGIPLTESHWEIIHLIRNYYLKFEHFPNMRMFVKLVGQNLGEDKGNSRYLHQLFPKGPLKYACKLAGLSKPPYCL